MSILVIFQVDCIRSPLSKRKILLVLPPRNSFEYRRQIIIENIFSSFFQSFLAIFMFHFSKLLVYLPLNLNFKGYIFNMKNGTSK